jgi:hypothetical protein
MKISLIFLGILFFFLGIALTLTILGAIVGVPLIFIGLIVFLMGIILPIRL